MCWCANGAVGRPICSHTMTWSFSNSLVAPSRGNCGGYFSVGCLAATAAIVRPTTATSDTLIKTNGVRMTRFTAGLLG